MLHLDSKLTINRETAKSPNLCDRFTEDELKRLGAYCFQGYQRDVASRAAWTERNKAGMDLAMQVSAAKAFPWPGCSNVVFPLISIAALQFSARSYSNIILGTEVVKYRVVGGDPQGGALERAVRIGCHMSWQCLEEDKPWEEQHDKLFTNLSIVGLNFIKSDFDGTKRHNTGKLVLAQDLVFDYWAKSVEDCARKTELQTFYRNDVYSKAKRGEFRDVTNEKWFTSPPQPKQHHQAEDRRQGTFPPPQDDQAPLIFHEQHCWFDFDHDGYAEPYVVTYEENSQCVVRIVARWDREEDVERSATNEIISIKSAEYYTKFGFIPAPDGSMMDIGFGTLLGPLNEAVNAAINQLIDSGTMNNAAGGFLGRGAKFKGGIYTMAPWEWKRVDATGDDLRKSLFPLPTREPSMVLFKLLDLLINFTQRLGGATDIMQGETPGQNTPAETSRNALEQGMQIYSTIFKRVWRSMKEEFKKLHRLNSIYLPTETTFGEKGYTVYRADYRTNSDNVVPVADPSVTSDAQRMQKAQLVRQAAATVPGYDRDAVELYFLRAARVEGYEALFPGSKKVPPGKSEKIQLEEMRMQLKQGALKLEAQKFQMTLAEQHRLNTAQIAMLESQALKLMHDAAIENKQFELDRINSIVEAMKSHNDMLVDKMGMAQQVLSAKDNSEQNQQALDQQQQQLAQQQAAQQQAGSSGE